jgi:hypothetical protein
MNWLKRLPTWAKWTLGIFVALIVIGAVAGDDEKDDKSKNPTSAAVESSSSFGDSESADEEEDGGCGIEATDDCTPEVGPKGKVRVDALVWQIQSAKTAASIGDQTYGLGEEANGVYLIVHLEVTSKKDESVTISEEVVSLVADGGNTYSTDSDGTFAAVGTGQDAFFFEDIGPDSTLEGVVVFDVPKSVLNSKLQLKFGELGFGDTTGYIEVPAV